jgi:transposase
LTDDIGLPVQLSITPGQTHDIQAAALLSDLKKGQIVLADLAYDADWLRAMVSEKGAWANIPPKSNRKSSLGEVDPMSSYAALTAD